MRLHKPITITVVVIASCWTASAGAEDLDHLFAEPDWSQMAHVRERVQGMGLLGALRARTSSAVATVLDDGLEADALASLVSAEPRVAAAQVRTTRARQTAVPEAGVSEQLTAALGESPTQIAVATPYEYTARSVDAGIRVADNTRSPLEAAVIGAITACHGRLIGSGERLQGDVAVSLRPVADIRVDVDSKDVSAERFATCLSGSLRRIVAAQPPRDTFALRATLTLASDTSGER